MQSASQIESCIQPNPQLGNGLAAGAIFDWRGFQNQESVEEHFCPERRVEPQPVPARPGINLSGCCDFNALLDSLVNGPGIQRQWNYSIAAANRGSIHVAACVRRTRGAALGDGRFAAVDLQRIAETKTIGRLDRQALENAILAKGFPVRPRRPQLPLRPLRVAAILVAADRARILDRP